MLTPPSPPAEKANACEDQAGQSCTGDGAGDAQANAIAALKAKSVLTREVKASTLVGSSPMRGLRRRADDARRGQGDKTTQSHDRRSHDAYAAPPGMWRQPKSICERWPIRPARYAGG